MRYSFAIHITFAGTVARLIDWPQVQCDASAAVSIPKLLRFSYVDMVKAYVQQRKFIPMPATFAKDFMQLNANMGLKVMLHNALMEQGVKRAHLCRQLMMSHSEVARLFDLSVTTNPDTLMDALHYLGYAFDVHPVNLKEINHGVSENQSPTTSTKADIH